MSDAPNALLQHYLVQLISRGVTHVPLNENAKQVLGLSGLALQVAKASPSLAAPASSKSARLAALAAQAEKSSECRTLGTLHDTMVFAIGSPDAEIMFIGEAPGAEEERQREPFVGPAGELLTKIIQAMGLTRAGVYISNICKFRPIVDDGRSQGSRNRPPTKPEMNACLPFIKEEIGIIQPRVIVALGATAAAGLGIEGSVSRIRGNFLDFNGTPILVTYHPSYLLRCEINEDKGIKEKRLVWEDMLKVMEYLGLPISAKQRAYFSKAGA